MGQYLHLNVSYIRHDSPGDCKSVNRSKGVLAYLYNQSCDAVLGTSPCLDDVPDFDITATYLEDGSALIAPNLKCSRFVGFVAIRPVLFIAVLSVAFILWVISLYLMFPQGEFSTTLYYAFNASVLTILATEKIQVKFFVISILLLSNIVITGVFQGKIYDSLVNENHACDVNSLQDIVERNLKTGVEQLIYDNVKDTTLRKENHAWIKKFFFPVTVQNLTEDNCHILREVQFRYLLPHLYMKENGDSKFRLIEILKRVQNSIFLYKRHPLLYEINFAILMLQQSGLNNFVLNKAFGHVQLKDIIKYSKRLSYFAPVKFEEVKWLMNIWIICLLVCTMVFLGEVLYWKMCFRIPYTN